MARLRLLFLLLSALAFIPPLSCFRRTQTGGEEHGDSGGANRKLAKTGHNWQRQVSHCYETRIPPQGGGQLFGWIHMPDSLIYTHARTRSFNAKVPVLNTFCVLLKSSKSSSFLQKAGFEKKLFCPSKQTIFCSFWFAMKHAEKRHLKKLKKNLLRLDPARLFSFAAFLNFFFQQFCFDPAWPISGR